MLTVAQDYGVNRVVALWMFKMVLGLYDYGAHFNVDYDYKRL